jgi:hypothetical protein
MAMIRAKTGELMMMVMMMIRAVIRAPGAGIRAVIRVAIAD